MEFLLLLLIPVALGSLLIGGGGDDDDGDHVYVDDDRDGDHTQMMIAVQQWSGRGPGVYMTGERVRGIPDGEALNTQLDVALHPARRTRLEHDLGERDCRVDAVHQRTSTVRVGMSRPSKPWGRLRVGRPTLGRRVDECGSRLGD